MKILHSADWHLDSPLVGKTGEHAAYLRAELLKIPDMVTSLCKREGCDLLFLAGDLFDGAYSKESYQAVYAALKEVGVPVFISPGNHDFCRADSPYETEIWPENVHIFRHPAMESIPLPALDCRVWGAGFDAMDCPALLKDFRAEGEERWQLGILHGDPTQASSPYCPVTAQQVRTSGLTYLALGHIHKTGSFRSGDAFCAWPGCAMGRGYDEPGEKGVLVVTVDEDVSARFLPLDTPRFFDISADVGDNAATTVADLLPAADTMDAYRVTLTGYSAPIDSGELTALFSHVPNLEIRDRTLPEMDLWRNIDEDSLEGVYFRTLHDGLDTDSEKLQRSIRLAAKISRQILDGQEVVLP